MNFSSLSLLFNSNLQVEQRSSLHIVTVFVKLEKICKTNAVLLEKNYILFFENTIVTRRGLYSRFVIFK